MFDLDKASSALQSWPVVNGFFIIVISFLAFMAIRKGEKDKKFGDGSEIPVYLVGRSAHEAMNAIRDAAEESKTTNAILRDIAKGMTDFNRGQKYTHELLTTVINNQEMRKTMAHGGPERKR